MTQLTVDDLRNLLAWMQVATANATLDQTAIILALRAKIAQVMQEATTTPEPPKENANAPQA